LIINLEQLKQILDLVREHELTELEIEHEGLRVKVRREAVKEAAKDATGVAAVSTSAVASPLLAALGGPPGLAAAGITSPAGGAVAGEAAELDIEIAVVKSPIVGTFYRSPEPTAPPFVEIGATVRKGQVLCIIEAMKLMNEIDSEYDGEIVSVYVETGQPVQYGERLFAIRTK